MTAATAFAQQTGTTVLQNRAAQYILGDRDEILMRVNIWGYVAKPGNYWVPRNTDLITLISFAGGPRDGANLRQVRILREGTAPPSSGATGGHEANDGQKKKVPVLKVDVKRYIETGESESIPVLRGGDTVIITATLGQKVRNSFSYISTIALIAQAAWWITLVTRN
jgi:protein involved in polysaccharide export with SLBB domain